MKTFCLVLSVILISLLLGCGETQVDSYKKGDSTLIISTGGDYMHYELIERKDSVRNYFHAYDYEPYNEWGTGDYVNFYDKKHTIEVYSGSTVYVDGDLFDYPNNRSQQERENYLKTAKLVFGKCINF